MRDRASHGVGALFGLGGLALSMWVMLSLETTTPDPPSDDGMAAVNLDVAEPPKPPPRPKPKPKPKPRKRSNTPPTPVLAAGLGGLDLGLGLPLADMGDATGALVGDVGDVVMTEDAVDDAPVPTDRVAPEYPARARAKATTGYVTLSLLVGADGGVRDVRVLEAQPKGVFDEVALMAVQQWRFQPATYEGRAVSVRVRQTLRFELE